MKKNAFKQGNPWPNFARKPPQPPIIPSPPNPTPPGLKEPPSDTANRKLPTFRGDPYSNRTSSSSLTPETPAPPTLDSPSPKKSTIIYHTKNASKQGNPCPISPPQVLQASKNHFPTQPFHTRSKGATQRHLWGGELPPNRGIPGQISPSSPPNPQ